MKNDILPPIFLSENFSLGSEYRGIKDAVMREFLSLSTPYLSPTSSREISHFVGEYN